MFIENFLLSYPRGQEQNILHKKPKDLLWKKS